ncbi:predicted protein [Verticillium alfalfae VaMs.102]|uniref:Predicted protein n=1 Tax=Verticillium alfalfae (strain VaMs.102 / ATCC MYA-4576 / FGSC 10136) TaxID=526221 RepID=C9SRV3_VERA1|nr:predicted protein [Verticillium alfalfae VaMs.102]EEY21518.1 predicted protein [Verticillium alfalfae VaMs.102]
MVEGSNTADANNLAYQFEGSMTLQSSEEESINLAHGQRTSHLVDAFKLSAVVDNEKYNFAYIDKKMVEIINEMTKHVSKFDPKRPVSWIRYAINKVPVLRRPSVDPFVTLELTVRLVRGRQNGLREPLSGQGPCQTAFAVDRSSPRWRVRAASSRQSFPTTAVCLMDWMLRGRCLEAWDGWKGCHAG